MNQRRKRALADQVAKHDATPASIKPAMLKKLRQRMRSGGGAIGRAAERQRNAAAGLTNAGKFPRWGDTLRASGKGGAR